MKRLWAIVIVLLSIATESFGQSNAFGLNIKVYQPLSGMSRNIDALPVGISFNYLHTGAGKKLSYGAELGVAMYSSNDYTLQYQGNDILVNEEDCFWTIHGVVRYNFIQSQQLSVYAEGRIGMTTFFSSIYAYAENSPYPGEFNFHGTAFNSGLGGGIMLNPHAIFSDDIESGSLWINLGANFHTGTYTNYRYMPEGGSPVPLDEGSYESLTHYMGYRVGVLLDIF